MLSLTSCNEQGQKITLNGRVPSVKLQGLVNRDGHIIPFNDVAVQRHYCVAIEKIAEIKLLLQNSKPLKSNVADDMVQRELDKMLLEISVNASY